MSAFKIAIVDDDQIGPKLLLKQLKGLGFQVTHFTSGELFLGSIGEQLPDLVLLDIVMPGISGVGVLKNLRDRFNSLELPVVMLTAKDEVAHIIEALELGANDYLTKPVHPGVASARIDTQVKLKEYYRDSLRKKELETLSAMIVTYNHEINNPLTIALGNVKSDISKMDNRRLNKVRESLKRISNIVISIRDIVKTSPNYSEYADSKKMIEVKKDEV